MLQCHYGYILLLALFFLWCKHYLPLSWVTSFFVDKHILGFDENTSCCRSRRHCIARNVPFVRSTSQTPEDWWHRHEFSSDRHHLVDISGTTNGFRSPNSALLDTSNLWWLRPMAVSHRTSSELIEHDLSCLMRQSTRFLSVWCKSILVGRPSTKVSTPDLNCVSTKEVGTPLVL